MDKTIYGQSKVMGFDRKVINLVFWAELLGANGSEILQYFEI